MKNRLMGYQSYLRMPWIREKYYLISRNGGFQTLLMVIILLFPVLAKKCFFYEDFESVEVRTQFFLDCDLILLGKDLGDVWLS